MLLGGLILLLAFEVPVARFASRPATDRAPSSKSLRSTMRHSPLGPLLSDGRGGRDASEGRYKTRCEENVSPRTNDERVIIRRGMKEARQISLSGLDTLGD